MCATLLLRGTLTNYELISNLLQNYLRRGRERERKREREREREKERERKREREIDRERERGLLVVGIDFRGRERETLGWVGLG